MKRLVQSLWATKKVTKTMSIRKFLYFNEGIDDLMEFSTYTVTPN